MAYYDPMHSSLEATKFQIQRGLQSLEEKLRLRRDIDRDIIYSRADQIARRNQLDTYEEELRLRETALYGGYSPVFDRERIVDRYAAERARDQLEEDEHATIHLDRLRRLEVQKLKLSRQRLGSGAHGVYSSCQKRRNYGYSPYDEDEMLLRKYQDGTRAKEYLDDLESHKNLGYPHHIDYEQKYSKNNNYEQRHQNNNNYEQKYTGNSQQKYHEQKHSNNYEQSNQNTYEKKYPSKQLAPQFQEQAHNSGYGSTFNSNKKQIYNRSPYAKLGDSKQKLSFEPDPKNKSVQKHVRISLDNQQSNQVLPSKTATFGGAKTSKQGSVFQNQKLRSQSQSKLNSSKQQQIYGSPAYYNDLQQRIHNQKGKSKGKGKNNRSSSKKSLMSKSAYKHTSSGSGFQSALDRSRSVVQSLEGNALKKIQNRLRLSEVVFEDSKFRNIKHQVNHLQNTYENQIKMRRDVKDKINNHPLILRKHAMVVE